MIKNWLFSVAHYNGSLGFVGSKPAISTNEINHLRILEIKR